MFQKFNERQLALLEQQYFCYDKPVPFKEKLIYPVLVKDYYKFHSSIPIFMLKKNEDPQGIPLSNLGYAILKMKDEKNGALYTTQMIQILELIFHVENGLYCENEECLQNGEHKIYKYEDIWEEANKLPNKEDQISYIMKSRLCPICHKPMREVISIKDEKGKESLCIKDLEINRIDYDYLFQLVLYQNIPTWEDVDFVDPDLKKELEERQRLLNKDTVPPTLEKQKCVIVARGCPYTYEELDEITIRRLSQFIANIDRMLHYQMYKSSELSGFVTYKSEIEHYLYSHKKKSITDDVFSLDDLTEKLKNVTK